MYGEEGMLVVKDCKAFDDAFVPTFLKKRCKFVAAAAHEFDADEKVASECRSRHEPGLQWKRY